MSTFVSPTALSKLKVSGSRVLQQLATKEVYRRYEGVLMRSFVDEVCFCGFQVHMVLDAVIMSQSFCWTPSFTESLHLLVSLHSLVSSTCPIPKLVVS